MRQKSLIAGLMLLIVFTSGCGKEKVSKVKRYEHGEIRKFDSGSMIIKDERIFTDHGELPRNTIIKPPLKELNSIPEDPKFGPDEEL